MRSVPGGFGSARDPSAERCGAQRRGTGPEGRSGRAGRLAGGGGGLGGRAAWGEIGYRVAPQGGMDPALSTVVRAFQRHWRPEAVTGQVDDGTLVRLLGVRELVRSG